MDVVVACSRCKKEIEGYKDENGTSGFYEIGPVSEQWKKFANEGETTLCNDCMWHDPRYTAVYGKVYSEV